MGMRRRSRLPARITWRRIIAWRRGSSATCLRRSPLLTLQRITRHQLVGMLPAGQGLDAVEPPGDRRMGARDVEAEFLGRIVEVADERDVRDGRALAEHECAAGQPLLEDREIAVDAALEKCKHGRIAGRTRQRLEEAERPEEAVELLVVEDDPAQRLESLVLALRRELAGAVREVGL